MSEQLVIAVLGLVGTLGAGLGGVWLTHWLERRRARAKQPVTETQKEGQKGLNVSPEIQIADLIQPPRSELSHAEIVKTIESAPPYHQSKIHDSFVGKRVTWKVALFDIAHRRDGVTVYAELPHGKGGLLTCYAKQKDTECFLATPKGAEFTVTGDIDRLSMYEASLLNCTFELAPS